MCVLRCDVGLMLSPEPFPARLGMQVVLVASKWVSFTSGASRAYPRSGIPPRSGKLRCGGVDACEPAAHHRYYAMWQITATTLRRSS